MKKKSDMTLKEMQDVFSTVLPGNYGTYHGDDDGYQQYCDDLEEIHEAQELLDLLIKCMEKYQLLTIVSVLMEKEKDEF